ncbi:MAG TPA: TauD/TfdA family dioxygenase [Caulobacter sp.]|nr:TauD/TfdA family dioxygenase [Caulobacter sp.]
MTHDLLTIERLEGCGALISGVDLAKVDARMAETLRSALFEYGVIFFRDQTLTRQQHLDLARAFAPIDVNRFFPADPEWPEIAKVEKQPDQTSNIGGGWHTDHSYDAEPALGSILVARDLPPSGGDTLFADMYAAWDSLPADLQDRVRHLKAVHSTAHVFGEGGAYAKSDQDALSGSRDLPETVHPVVIRHPGSGKPVLYVNPAFTTGIVGLGKEESDALLFELYPHAIDKTRTTRFAWQPGSVAIWDNRATWHFALNDYHGHYRLMHRVTMAGVPLEPAFWAFCARPASLPRPG